jgi:hypothetical protein
MSSWMPARSIWAGCSPPSCQTCSRRACPGATPASTSLPICRTVRAQAGPILLSTRAALLVARSALYPLNQGASSCGGAEENRKKGVSREKRTHRRSRRSDRGSGEQHGGDHRRHVEEHQERHDPDRRPQCGGEASAEGQPRAAGISRRPRESGRSRPAGPARSSGDSATRGRQCDEDHSA